MHSLPPARDNGCPPSLAASEAAPTRYSPNSVSVGIQVLPSSVEDMDAFTDTSAWSKDLLIGQDKDTSSLNSSAPTIRGINTLNSQLMRDVSSSCGYWQQCKSEEGLPLSFELPFLQQCTSEPSLAPRAPLPTLQDSLTRKLDLPPTTTWTTSRPLPPF